VTATELKRIHAREMIVDARAAKLTVSKTLDLADVEQLKLKAEKAVVIEAEISGTNVAPLATADVVDTTENDAVTTDVLANDTDVNPTDVLALTPGSATITLMTRDTDGSAIPVETASLAEVGNSIVFDPMTDFDFLAVGESATVLLVYAIHDGNGGSDTATVEIAVNGVNDTPSAEDNSYTTVEDIAVVGNVISDNDGIGADRDPDNSDVLAVSEFNGEAFVVGTVTTLPSGSTLTLSSSGDFTYVPALGFSGADSFDYTLSDGNSGADTATVNIQVNNLVDVAGRVFDDLDNDGKFEPADGDAGIANVTVQVWDEAITTLFASTTTQTDGTYLLDANLDAGNYTVLELVDELADLGLLDGKETAGSTDGAATTNGAVVNHQDSNRITGISVGAAGTTDDAFDYLFAEVRTADIFGMVWRDFNNDGESQLW